MVYYIYFQVHQVDEPNSVSLLLLNWRLIENTQPAILSLNTNGNCVYKCINMFWVVVGGFTKAGTKIDGQFSPSATTPRNGD